MRPEAGCSGLAASVRGAARQRTSTLSMEGEASAQGNARPVFEGSNAGTVIVPMGWNGSAWGVVGIQ